MTKEFRAAHSAPAFPTTETVEALLSALEDAD